MPRNEIKPHYKVKTITGTLKVDLGRYMCFYIDIDISIYLSTAIGLTPGGTSIVHIYTQTIDRTTKLTTNNKIIYIYIEREREKESLIILSISIYLLTEIGLTPGGSTTVHIYTQTIHRTTHSTQTLHRKRHKVKQPTTCISVFCF
jgi:hypothetical protein